MPAGTLTPIRSSVPSQGPFDRPELSRYLGYLSPDDLGLNNVTIPKLSGVNDDLWVVGYNSFTAHVNATGGPFAASLKLQFIHLDPEDLSIQLSDPIAVGTGIGIKNFPSNHVYHTIRLSVLNTSGPAGSDITGVTVHLFASMKRGTDTA